MILLQPVATTCRASVAFSGGHAWGAFRNTQPQEDLDVIDTYAEQFARVRLDHPNVVFVQLLLFNDQTRAPSLKEVAEWAHHFGFDRSRSVVVLAGTHDLATAASREVVPGFQLIDQNFLLRVDSTGLHPKDDLYRDMLPLMGQLLKP